MKRYRANSDMRAVYGEKTILHEDTEGPYVKFEDVKEMLTSFVSNIQFINIKNPRTYAEYIIREYGKDFIR